MNVYNVYYAKVTINHAYTGEVLKEMNFEDLTQMKVCI